MERVGSVHGLVPQLESLFERAVDKEQAMLILHAIRYLVAYGQ